MGGGRVPGDGVAVIGTLVLLVILAVPLVAWAVLRSWRGRDRSTPSTGPTGPKHRWWQP